MSSAVAERGHCKDFTLRRRSLERKRGDDLWLHHSVDECGVFEKNFDIPFSTVLERALDAFPSIAMDSDVLSGTPRIAGTRIPVYMVLDAVEFYGTMEGALKSYPDLTKQQIKDAVAFAGAILEHPVEHES